VQRAAPAIQRAAAAQQRAALSAGEFGDIIGWGTGQTARAVSQTQAVTQALTTEAVQGMIAKGLTREFVQNQLAMYSSTFAKGGEKLVNKQLVPRLELMQRILDLWPE
jgi:hypothetical protein